MGFESLRRAPTQGRIPHHRPCIRKELPDRVFATSKEKWTAVADEILVRHARKQPILVGTRSVEDRELLRRHLAKPVARYLHGIVKRGGAPPA
jgi:preprotein translocase subunit SecA